MNNFRKEMLKGKQKECIWRKLNQADIASFHLRHHVIQRAKLYKLTVNWSQMRLVYTTSGARRHICVL